MSEMLLTYAVGVLLGTVTWLWITRREQRQRADRLLHRVGRLDLLRHEVSSLHAQHQHAQSSVGSDPCQPILGGCMRHGRCRECDKPWPCPTRRLTDRARREVYRR